MYKIKSQSIETMHFGNGWGLYVDIENYHYKLDEYSNKIIKRNRIYNNDYGTEYDYDYDFEEKYKDTWPILKATNEEKNTASSSFIKITSATIIIATASFLLFHMS